MSRFDELDHRLGRHDSTPKDSCPDCFPAANKREAPTRRPKFWDHEGLVAPAFPSWGDIWERAGEVFVFVNNAPDPRADSKPFSGFWTPLVPYVEQKIVRGAQRADIRTPSLIEEAEEATRRNWGGLQVEIGSGTYAPRVLVLATKQVMPSETIRIGALGVDMKDWAEEKTYAQLIVDLTKKGLTPISNIVLTHDSNPAKDTMEIRASVYAMHGPEDLSYQMTMPF